MESWFNQLKTVYFEQHPETDPKSVGILSIFLIDFYDFY